MGTYSHAPLSDRDLMRLAPNPPSPPRKCGGSTFRSWVKNPDDPDGPPGVWDGCEARAVPFIPEVAYCAHHMPPEWAVIARQRRLLWARLNADVWEQVCDEYPGLPLRR